jgi:Protein of unknown function (DUF1186)
MEPRELLVLLDRYQGSFPDQLITEAIARRDGIVPVMLETLEAVAADPEPWLADQQRMGHIYAMHLLALFRETRTYPLLVRIFSRSGEFAYELAGDTVTEDLGRILASVSGDLSGMVALIENEEADEYVRSAAMNAMVSLVKTGQRTRDEIMAYVLQLFGRSERKPGAQWDGLADVCADLWPQEAMSELQHAYEDGLVDTFATDWEDIQHVLSLGKEEALHHHEYRTPLITDLAKDMGWMQCFQKAEPYPDGDEDGVWEEDREWDEAGALEHTGDRLALVRRGELVARAFSSRHTKDWPQRALPLWQRQEIQEMLRARRDRIVRSCGELRNIERSSLLVTT